MAIGQDWKPITRETLDETLLKEIFKENDKGLVNRVVIKDEKLYLKHNDSNDWRFRPVRWLSKVWHWYRHKNTRISDVRTKIVELYTAAHSNPKAGLSATLCQDYLCTEIFLDRFDKRMIGRHTGWDRLTRWDRFKVTPFREYDPSKKSSVEQSFKDVFDERTKQIKDIFKDNIAFDIMEQANKQVTELVEFANRVQTLTMDLNEKSIAKQMYEIISTLGVDTADYYAKRKALKEAKEFITSLKVNFDYSFADLIKAGFSVEVPALLPATTLEKLSSQKKNEVQGWHKKAEAVKAIAEGISQRANDTSEFDEEKTLLGNLDRLRTNWLEQARDLNTDSQNSINTAYAKLTKYSVALWKSKAYKEPLLAENLATAEESIVSMKEFWDKAQKLQTTLEKYIPFENIQLPISKLKSHYYIVSLQAKINEGKELLDKKDRGAQFEKLIDVITDFMATNPPKKETLERLIKEQDELYQVFKIQKDIYHGAASPTETYETINEIIQALSPEGEKSLLKAFIADNLEQTFTFVENALRGQLTVVSDAITDGEKLEYASPNLQLAANMVGLCQQWTNIIQGIFGNRDYSYQIQQLEDIIAPLKPLATLFCIGLATEAIQKPTTDNLFLDTYVNSLPQDADQLIFHPERLVLMHEVKAHYKQCSEWPAIKDWQKVVKSKDSQQRVNRCHMDYMKEMEIDVESIQKAVAPTQDFLTFQAMFEDKLNRIVNLIQLLEQYQSFIPKSSKETDNVFFAVFVDIKNAVNAFDAMNNITPNLEIISLSESLLGLKARLGSYIAKLEEVEKEKTTDKQLFQIRISNFEQVLTSMISLIKNLENVTKLPLSNFEETPGNSPQNERFVVEE